MTADLCALRAFFEPSTVAVIGAGTRRQTVGGELFHNLACGGFRGRVVPVNPHAATVQGVPAVRTLREVHGAVDLAVIAVSASAVDTAVDDCIAHRVRAVVIISAGFGETGAAGGARERALAQRLRDAGIRLIGPNCLGLLSTAAGSPINATFALAAPPPGRIAFCSQSGALGLAMLDYASRLHIGLSSFVSIGNAPDVSTIDLLEYWEHDPDTDVILLYIESLHEPRRFAEVARRVARRKPVVAMKAGRSAAGARAAASHTGALAASDALVDALFEDAGVIRAETIEDLFDLAWLLAHQPLPAGDRVAILTNGGGPGILAADACEAHGLTVPALAPATIEALRAFLPGAAGTGNPVDLLATASADDYRRAMPILLRDPAVDAVIGIFIPPLVARPADVARAMAETARPSPKPVLAVFFGAPDAAAQLGDVPCFDFPEPAVAALAHAVQRTRWLARPAVESHVTADLDPAAVQGAVASALPAAASDAAGWLDAAACQALLAAAGIRALPTRLVYGAEQALAAAHELGFPVVLKGTGAAILHKTEAGAVIPGLADEQAVLRAWHTLHAKPAVEAVLVQPMVTGGVEMIVGATRDDRFGPVVLCGSGGVLVELLRDTVCRLAPATDDQIRVMLDRVRGIHRLRGFRGAPAADEAALRDIIRRVSLLVDACPAIAELDLNPVFVTAAGAWAADVRVRVTAPAAETAIPERAIGVPSAV